MPLSKKQLGKAGEEQACQFLQSQGLKLIDKNFYSRFGEIDLIMLDNNYLVFIEVRSRKNMGFGSSLESITLVKQNKLRKTADFFFLKNVHYNKMPARFDVVLIPPTSINDQINWLQNAF
ncbi:MAG: YraN family protein [Pseudomonadota bacterium]